MLKIYYNLTCGIEFHEMFNNKDVNFIRIQSSLCEAKCWSRLIDDLDYSFLIDLAIGYKVIVVDGTTNKNSKAIYQGLPWIRYVLNRKWFDREVKSVIKSYNMIGYYRDIYKRISKHSINKIKYARRFLNCNRIQLEGVSFNTNNDGNEEFYRALLLNIKEGNYESISREINGELAVSLF